MKPYAAPTVTDIHLDTPTDGFAFDWRGVRTRLPISAGTAGYLYSAQLSELAPGAGNPPHCHSREDEVFVVLEGEVTFRVADQTITAGPNDLLFAPRGLPHTLKNNTDQPAQLLVLLTPGQQESAFLEVADRGPESMATVMPRFGVTMLDNFDPDYRHHDVPEPAVPLHRTLANAPAFSMAGDRYTLLLESSDTAHRLAAVHFDLPPGGGPLPHTHLIDHEAFFVLSGQVTLFNGDTGQTVTAGPGDVASLPAGIPHAFRNTTDQPAAMLALTAPSGFDRLIRAVGTPLGPGDSPNAPDAAELERLDAAAAVHHIELRPDLTFDP